MSRFINEREKRLAFEGGLTVSLVQMIFVYRQDGEVSQQHLPESQSAKGASMNFTLNLKAALKRLGRVFNAILLLATIGVTNALRPIHPTESSPWENAANQLMIGFHQSHRKISLRSRNCCGRADARV